MLFISNVLTLKCPVYVTIRIGINYIYPFKYCREEKEFIESEIHENEDLAEQVYCTVYTVQCTVYNVHHSILCSTVIHNQSLQRFFLKTQNIIFSRYSFSRLL